MGRDYTDGGRLPTIEEMSGSIDFGGKVVFEDGEPCVLTPEESEAPEHARLERAVVEAAKAYRAGKLNSSRDLINAVDKLDAFEGDKGND